MAQASKHRGWKHERRKQFQSTVLIFHNMQAISTSRLSRQSYHRWLPFCAIFLITLTAAPSTATAFVAPSQVKRPLSHNAAFVTLSHAERPFSTALFGRRGKGKVEKKPLKANLPEKVCVVCGRPFTWRKKWERDWENITCCSKSCNTKRRAGNEDIDP